MADPEEVFMDLVLVPEKYHPLTGREAAWHLALPHVDEEDMADARVETERLIEAFQKDRENPIDPTNPGYLVVLGRDLTPDQSAMTLNLLLMVPGVVGVTAVEHSMRTMSVDNAARQLMRERLQAVLDALR